MNDADPVNDMENPHHEYAARLADRRSLVDRLFQRERAFSLARMVTFLFGATMFVDVFTSKILSPYWLLPPLVLFVVLVVLHDRTIRTRTRILRAVEFYEKGVARLENRWAGTGFAGIEYFEKKHPYADDLDVFGEGSLFELLCTAKTKVGRDTLARWLSGPTEPSVIRERQEAVKELTPLLDLREDLARIVGDPSEFMEPEVLAHWASAPVVCVRPYERILAGFLSALSCTMLVVLCFGRTSALSFLAVVAVQLVLFQFLRKRVNRIIDSVGRISQGLNTYSLVLRRLEKESFTTPHLRRMSDTLSQHGAVASAEIKRLGNLVKLLEDGRRNMAFIPFALLLFWSTQIACAIEKWRERNGPRIGHWIEVAGEMEALSSLARNAYEHPADSFPEISEAGLLFSGDELGHPLMSEKECVRNSIRLDFENGLVIMSGSNMSGKSTFLRTIGANTVLALTGAPVRARELRLSPFTIAASIQIRDSLQEGVSKFYAEIKRVREMMDKSREPNPLLFLIDEIFQGTNSHDRRIAAGAILRKLVKNGAVGVITTHDLALTKIADELSPRARNVHFEDRVTDGKMVFDYQLRPGVIQHGNALFLLKSIGLEV